MTSPHFALSEWKLSLEIKSYSMEIHGLDVHGSVHHNTNLIGMTIKMQLSKTIYYSVKEQWNSKLSYT
jgi:hypothetical protein